jgi:hypothetical protein
LKNKNNTACKGPWLEGGQEAGAKSGYRLQDEISSPEINLSSIIRLCMRIEGVKIPLFLHISFTVLFCFRRNTSSSMKPIRLKREWNKAILLKELIHPVSDEKKAHL